VLIQRFGVDVDQSAGSADQTLADADQTGADDDASAAERDQESSERDQELSDRDQASADRQHASADGGGNAAGYHEATAERAQVTEERGTTNMARTLTGLQRDVTSEERDSTADLRDDRAALRDAQAAELEAAIATSDPELARRFEQLRRQAAADRAEAARDRARAARDRAESARERARLEAELVQSHVDDLTGAYRRSMGRIALSHGIDRARRGDGRFIAAFIDVDGLKHINDRDGHAAGDLALKAVVTALRSRLRSFDPVLRYGGDEFVAGVGGIEIEAAKRRFESIAETLSAEAGIHISVGIASLAMGETVDELIVRADAALIRQRRALRDALDSRDPATGESSYA
jgi:diguanylate cyclase (GGDEF)-like protein